MDSEVSIFPIAKASKATFTKLFLHVIFLLHPTLH